MKIVIVSTNKFPDGDAGAIREEALAKCCIECGNSVTLIGMGETTNYEKRNKDNISYYSLRGSDNSIYSKIKYYMSYWRKVQSLLLREQPDVIIASVISGHYLIKLKQYSRRNNIKLVVDCVEWYSPMQFGLKWVSPIYIDNNVTNGCIIDKNICAISISSYFHNYFTNKGIKSVRIPAIMDVDNIPYDISVKKKNRTIVYAGSPGKKDKMAEIIDAIYLMNQEERQRLRFCIIGVTKSQLVSMCGVDYEKLKSLKGVVKVLGRIPREDVVRILTKADYTVLIRDPNKRHAKAGFPSKFVESLSTGTPVICNLSSDLSMYLDDGKNGLVCEYDRMSSLTKAIARAVNQSDEELINMKKNARVTAEEYFDYKRYGAQISGLMGTNK